MKSKTLMVLLAILLFSATGAFAARDKNSGKSPDPGSDTTPCTEIDMATITVPQDFFIVYISGDSDGNRPGPRTHIEVHANGILKYFKGNWKGGSPQLPLEQRETPQESVLSYKFLLKRCSNALYIFKKYKALG